MATVAVLIDLRKHTLASALLAIIAGTALGIIGASSIVALMGWPEQVGYGVASIFSISGNNLVKWLLRISKDPTELWDKWRGK